MPLWVSIFVQSSWAALLLVWIVTFVQAKPSLRVQKAPGRIAHIVTIGLAFLLLFWDVPLVGFLRRRVFPANKTIWLLGIAFTICGAAVAIWARLYLGSNWSASVMIKHEHTLICSGPYAVARHPIYLGLLMATLGTALCSGVVRGLVALSILFTTLLVKSRIEESFLVEQFRDEYLRYQCRVKALIPFVL